MAVKMKMERKADIEESVFLSIFMHISVLFCRIMQKNAKEICKTTCRKVCNTNGFTKFLQLMQ